jgi:hypothetical protein
MLSTLWHRNCSGRTRFGPADDCVSPPFCADSSALTYYAKGMTGNSVRTSGWWTNHFWVLFVMFFGVCPSMLDSSEYAPSRNTPGFPSLCWGTNAKPALWMARSLHLSQTTQLDSGARQFFSRVSLSCLSFDLVSV